MNDFNFDMSNKDIKASIDKATRFQDEFKIIITLWHIAEGINNSLDIYNEDGNSIGNTLTGSNNMEIEDTEENIKSLKKESKKLVNYLKKHYDNIELKEETC